MKALLDSIVRTVVPVIVGAALAWVARLGIPVDPEFEGALAGVLTAVFTGLYYIAVRLLETHVTPRLGWLLGLPKQPNYDAIGDEVTYGEIRDDVLVRFATLPPDEQEAEYRAALARMQH